MQLSGPALPGVGKALTSIPGTISKQKETQKAREGEGSVRSTF